MIELGKGSLCFGNSLLGHGDLYVTDIPMSQYEEQAINLLLEIHKPAEISCEIKAVDLNLLNDIGAAPLFDNLITLTYQKPIMIQARWHKKHRTRKKWLKRYGMKPDTVEVSCQAHAINYDIDGSFDIDANSMKYKWKPHQQRRGIKVEPSEFI